MGRSLFIDDKDPRSSAIPVDTGFWYANSFYFALGRDIGHAVRAKTRVLTTLEQRFARSRTLRRLSAIESELMRVVWAPEGSMFRLFVYDDDV